MALDERKYKTMKFMKCKKCGYVFVASLTGTNECPECSSGDVGYYRPDGRENNDETTEE